MESTTDEVKTEQQEGTRAGLARLRWNVAGIDIGARKMQVCAPVSEQAREVRTYETTTEEILNCACWLKQVAVESVAMESTGVYWIPVLEMLESCGMETLLVDTRPLSRVPGRKTDVNDCQWIQTLHSHGLLQGSFRPSEEISQLRILVRQKAVLVSEQADWTRRMHKSLDQMNVRVHHAVSDLQGTTGMAIIRAIVGGERDPKKLAGLRDPRCRNSQERIAAPADRTLERGPSVQSETEFGGVRLPGPANRRLRRGNPEADEGAGGAGKCGEEGAALAATREDEGD